MCEYERGTVADAAVLLLQCQGIVHVLPVKTGTVDGAPGFQQAQLVKKLEGRPDYPGGMNWFSPEAELIVPLVEKAIKEKKLVAGICNASVFLGMHGFLNEVKHTSNTLNYLKQYAGDKYTGDSNYINEQAVRDENIVTANGTGQLEFCKEILYALEADTADAIEESYLFYKNGFCPGA